MSDYSNLADYRARLVQLIADPSAAIYSDASAQDQCINAAVRRYSRDVPRWEMKTLTGNGTQQAFDFTEWVPDFSVIRDDRIEYPAGSVPPEWYDDEYYLYQNDNQWQIVLHTAPSSGTTARFWYSVLHYITDDPGGESSVQLHHAEAVCKWALYEACMIEATRSNERPETGTMETDSVDLTRNAEIWAARGSEARDYYLEIITGRSPGGGGSEKTVRAAGKALMLDSPLSTFGRRPISHR